LFSTSANYIFNINTVDNVDNTVNRGVLSTIGFQNGVLRDKKRGPQRCESPVRCILLLGVSDRASKVLLLAHLIRLDQPRPKLIIDLA
jgi:hypothetical protein